MGLSSGKTSVGILALSSALLAAPTGPEGDASATAPALPDGPLRIIIRDFVGNVQARQTSDAPWTPVAPGQEFDEGVEFRTGVRSVVRFKIPPDSDLTVDRLGVVKILRATIESGTIKTDVGMKYGRTRYDIEAAGRVHDAKIRSTTSVLAIRGTQVILDDTPGFAPRAVSLTGRASFRDNRGRETSLGSPGGDPNRPVRIDAAAGPTAADTGLQQSVTISPLNAGRTPAENALVVNIPQAGGLPPPPGNGGTGAQLQAISNAPPPAFNPPTVPPPPVDFPSLIGRLEFVLTWQGNADLNIGVVSPLGEPVTTNPANITTIPDRQTSPVGTTAPRSGGIASADNFGTSGGGTESVTWPNGFPSGRYDYGVRYKTGQTSAQYKIDVLVNGVTLEPSTTGTLPGPSFGGDFEGNAIEIGSPTGSSASPTAGTSTVQGTKRKKKRGP